jgi:hypothetical protein
MSKLGGFLSAAKRGACRIRGMSTNPEKRSLAASASHDTEY